jgi:hypothetical protein
VVLLTSDPRWFDEVDFIAQSDLAIRVPIRAHPGTIAIGRKNKVLLGEQTHEAVPLGRTTGIRVNADYSGAGTSFANKRAVAGHGDLETVVREDRLDF